VVIRTQIQGDEAEADGGVRSREPGASGGVITTGG
jgi:hypothetical protein